VLDEHGPRAQRVADELRDEFGVRACASAVDVADRAAVDNALAAIQDQLGVVDILINNAAINIQGSIFDYDPDVFERVLAVDLTACFYLSRVVLPSMRDRGWGRIVNVSSVAAYMGGNGREPAYSVAKAGLNELTRAVALEGGPYGIRCNAVAPGLVNSKWVEKQRERYDTFLEATPLRRHAEPVDVANTIVFLCCDESAHITGEIVTVSGGWYLRP
jgi:NAD(P)-dependent dehydrogenase (short-subunit alcohol dehydrogenase family)